MKLRALVLVTSMTLAMFACGSDDSSGGLPRSPEGSFKAPSITFTFKSGTFRIEHTASSGDNRDYVVEGTYTSTSEFSNAENETSYGHVDLTVSAITLAGAPASGLDVTTAFKGDDINPGSTMPGWWKWTGLVTYGGKMQIRLNVPQRTYRPEDPFSGVDWLLIGDP